MEDKSIIDELLLIDNKIQYTNLTYESLLDSIIAVDICNVLDGDSVYVAITDGEVQTVLKVIICTPKLSTLYINRTFLSINKYLVSCANKFYEFEKIQLDSSKNYQKYINSANKVILSGFDTFVEELSNEFNQDVIIL